MFALLSPYSEFIEIMRSYGPNYLSDYEMNLAFRKEICNISAAEEILQGKNEARKHES